MKTTITLTREEVTQIIRDHFKTKYGNVKAVFPKVQDVSDGCGMFESTRRDFVGYEVVVEDK